MPKNSYDEILERATGELSREELLKLSEALTMQAFRKMPANPRSILELRGLGKEVWEGIDPDEYVAQERDSWE
jgi:hypothetical protein